MQPMEPMVCPVCGRMDGGHDQVIHDIADSGGTVYPVSPKAGV